jgi:hypothetical protein
VGDPTTGDAAGHQNTVGGFGTGWSAAYRAWPVTFARPSTDPAGCPRWPGAKTIFATEPYRVAWDRQRVSALSLPASRALILSAAADMERHTVQ